MKTDLVVSGFLIHNKKVLLVFHKKLNQWLPLGGHIKKNETPDEALKREIKEELGIEIEIFLKNDLPLIGQTIKNLPIPFHIDLHSVGDHNHCCFYFICKTKTPEKIKINDSELKSFAWFSKKDLEQNNIRSDDINIALKSLELPV